MENLNVFYRAYKAYKEAFNGNKSIAEFSDVIKKSTTHIDSLKTVRNYAIIEEEWVKTIEEEMVYVEKAIREDRQFIRQEGNVLPIEKVKKVSTHSVKHLAMHSELLSKDSIANKDLIPDGLYVVEKLTDYAVYENRFLYMLLNHVRDFITIRLDKILELGMTYKSDLNFKKDVSFNHRIMTYEAKMHDENRRDPHTASLGNGESMIKRLQDQLGLVHMLMNTPLMQEVSKAPMLKPPIIKTNVLLMNNNFRHALELYHYISSYDKPGYEIKEIKNLISPFTESIMQDFSNIVMLTSMISYQYGNKLTEQLEIAFQKEEERLKRERDEKKKKQIKDLKARVEKTGKGMEEYVLLLEERNKELEGDRTKNIILTTKIEQLNVKIEELTSQIKSHLAQIDSLREEVENWKAKYELDMATQKQEYEDKIAKIIADNESKYQQTVKEYEDKLAKQEESYQAQIAQLNSSWQNKLDDSIKSYEAKLSDLKNVLDAQINIFKSEKSAMEQENQSCKNQINQLVWRNTLVKAELTALRAEHGLIPASEDYTDKARFKELEKEFEAFIVLFKSQWEHTKRRIKKDIMSVYPQKLMKKVATDVDVAGEPLPKDNVATVEEQAPQDAGENCAVKTDDNNID